MRVVMLITRLKLNYQAAKADCFTSCLATRCLLILSLVLAACATIYAASDIADYHARVDEALSLLEDMDALAFENRGAEQIKKLLPQQEQIIVRGQVIEIDNTWLYDIASQLEKANSPADKEAAFEQIRSRLTALDNHLVELQETEAGPVYSTERQKLEAILSRSEFRVKKGETLGEKLRRWIMDLLERLIRWLPTQGTTFNSVLKMIIILAGVVVAAVLGLMLKRMFTREKRVKEREKRTVLGEELDQEVTANELLDAALRLAREGDYRGAIRKLYISLLFQMDEQRIIQLESSATNRDYLRKLRLSGNARLFSAMEYLTGKFDYFWYGKFASSEADFSDFLSRYRELIQEISPGREVTQSA